MNITLNDDEIKDGLVAYIATQGIDLNQKHIEVSLTAGRGPNGYSADVMIVPNANDVPAVTAVEVTEEPEDNTTVFNS